MRVSCCFVLVCFRCVVVVFRLVCCCFALVLRCLCVFAVALFLLFWVLAFASRCCCVALICLSDVCFVCLCVLPFRVAPLFLWVPVLCFCVLWAFVLVGVCLLFGVRVCWLLLRLRCVVFVLFMLDVCLL